MPKTSASSAGGCCSYHSQGIYSDLETGTLVVWHYWASGWTGWPGASTL